MKERKGGPDCNCRKREKDRENRRKNNFHEMSSLGQLFSKNSQMLFLHQPYLKGIPVPTDNRHPWLPM